jgi:hypothetical protein
MVALKLQNFGGMIPAVDDRLLPQDQAALSQNAWLYHGTIEGLPEPYPIYTASNAATSKVYRIPKQYYDKSHISDSYWLEFNNPDTDIIHTPITDDSYERFYWASSQSYDQIAPHYNTKARIIAGLPAYLLGIPSPTVAPYISRLSGSYILSATSLSYSTRGSTARIYHSSSYAVDTDTFANNALPVVDTSIRYKVTGSRAELRYGTLTAGIRVTIDDRGEVTLGVPSQNQSSTLTDTGTGVLTSRSYVYTWISAYGEESAPSEPTVFNGWSGDPWVIKVTAPDSSITTNRNITTVRIYRTITGASGAATYFQVADLPISQTVYADTVDDVTVSGNNQLQSTYWTPPPSNLEGIIMMPNGIMAGWKSNEVWFSEPYRPHAWPVSYVVNTEYPIVGLGVMGQTLIACTTTYPYAITGINPASMSMSRIASLEPCLSRGSIVSSIEGVLYASPNGLVLAAPGVAIVITRQMITRDQWLNLLNVSTLRATKFNNAYYCWGATRPGAFQKDAFQNTAFVQVDYTGSYNGALIDFNNQRVGWNSLTSDSAVTNLWADPWTGEIFIFRNGQVLWFDVSVDRTHGAYKWRSKVMEMPNKRNLEAMRVWFTVPSGITSLNPVQNTSQNQPTLASDQWGLVRIYADGNLVMTRELRTSGEFFRMPSGFRSTYWQIEIEARVTIWSVEAATTAKELINV